MQTVNVDLANRSYTVYIGSGLLGKPHPVFDTCKASTALIVSNETVAPLYLDRLAGALTGADVHSLILPDGESYKTAEQWL
ncbi:MAG TPA: 3-dehydroquinate synthase, partial [Xanthomonadales bacterium]